MLTQLTLNSSKWSLTHYEHALDLLSYLYETRHKGLMFRQSPQAQNRLYGYADADLGDSPSGKSRSGKVIFFNGSLIVAKSSLQTTVSISTCTSELIALSDCAMNMQRLINLLNELKFAQNEPCVIDEDNTACKPYSNYLLTDYTYADY